MGAKQTYKTCAIYSDILQCCGIAPSWVVSGSQFARYNLQKAEPLFALKKSSAGNLLSLMIHERMSDSLKIFLAKILFFSIFYIRFLILKKRAIRSFPLF